MNPIFIGIDVGQRAERTGIAVVEREQRPDALAQGVADYYIVRYLDRLPAGTGYPVMVERLRGIVAGLIARHQGPGQLTIDVCADVTGLGQPIVDLLRSAYHAVIPVYFTHGDRFTLVQEPVPYIQMGKAWLVANLQALLQTGRLLLPDTPAAQALAHDLLDYQIDIAPDANEKYGAFSVGQQDDLVTALGMAALPSQPQEYQMLVTLDDLWTPEDEQAFQRGRQRIGYDPYRDGIIGDRRY